ncbi:MAG: hypothetical protein VX278_12145 [Myxococcota bacterium]|nr:hypothetical protein [Myxococcota bacterium]
MKYLILTLLVGCSEYDSSKVAFEDFDADEVPNSISSQEFRVDIYPSTDSNNLLSQSFYVNTEDVDLSNLRFDLAETVSLSGYVKGYSVFPHSDGEVTVPGENVPVEAQLQLSEQNSLSGSVFNSDSSGWFDISVPANDAYQFTVTPISPIDLPFRVSSDFLLRESQNLEIDLGFGRPVFGSVIGLEGRTNDAYVQLLDAQTYTKGPKIPIEEDGSFVLRAPNDRENFILRIEGEPNSSIPTLDTPFRIEQDESEGTSIEIDIGTISPVTVSGELRTSNGSYPETAVIRFVSQDLFNAEGSLRITTSNDNNAFFAAPLLPGKWKAEFIPPYEDTEKAAPTELEFTIEEGSADHQLDDVYLRSDIRISSRVLDPQGQPAANVLVTLQETGFNNHIYNGTTDSEGWLEMQVPPVSLNVKLTPTNSITAITHLTIPPPEDDQELQWSLQSGIPVRGNFYYRNLPISYALLEIWSDDKIIASTLTNESGSFDLRLQLED